MEKRGKILFLLFVTLIVLSLYFDSEIVRGISLIRNNIFNEFFLGLTFISSEIIIFFFLTSLFLFKEHKRRWILPLWFTLGLSVIISFLLKNVIQRKRPFQLGLVSVLPVLEKSSHLIWDYSFPSFQAMLAFCAIPILSKGFPRLKYFWIVFACFIAFSRVYFGLHFLSDVIAGGLIGYLLGVFVVKLEKEYNLGEKICKRIFGR